MRSTLHVMATKIRSLLLSLTDLDLFHTEVSITLDDVMEQLTLRADG